MNLFLVAKELHVGALGSAPLQIPLRPSYIDLFGNNMRMSMEKLDNLLWSTLVISINTKNVVDISPVQFLTWCKPFGRQIVPCGHG